MEGKNKSTFIPEQSPMAEAYKMLGAKTPLELHLLWVKEDQKLMKSHTWDYDNPNLVVNQIKEIFENISEENLTEEEKEWRRETLWFWYHHATSFALVVKKDLSKAEKCVLRALELQGEDHPNQITPFLYLLIQNKYDEAEKFANNMKEEVEKKSALELIEEHNQGLF